MASIALDNIWDAPLTESPPRQHATGLNSDNVHSSPSARHTKRPRSSLFFDSDSGNEAPRQGARQPAPTAVNRSEIDAMFDNLDDESMEIISDLPPSLDVEALRRHEDAKNAKAFAKSSPLETHEDSSGNVAGGKEGDAKGTKEKEKRKALPKLGEARLLGPDGFPALVKQTKNFRPRGRGHEAADLNRLLQVYQFWTHKMYPKTQFLDTVQRVEKLCHSKRMHVALSVWRDESKGIINGRNIDVATNTDDSSSDEYDHTEKAKPHVKADIQSDERSSRPSSRRPSASASEPPSSDAYDDFDIDALIREDQERQQANTAASPSMRSDANPIYRSKDHSRPTNVAIDENEAMWDELMGGLPDSDVQLTEPSQTTQLVGQLGGNPHVLDEGTDMWDIVTEMEAADSAPHSVPETDTSRSRPTNEEGWDDMYF